jgi:GNAT superfamily N-acetyltransferase
MMRPCTDTDVPTIHSIVNEAAEAYRGVIPADCWHDPYMALDHLVADIGAGIHFLGWEEGGELLGVMGLQTVRDVTLIRHAYVRTSHQGRGIGGQLMTTLLDRTPGRVLVGTWADAEWAIRFYQRYGFRLVTAEDKDRLLSEYWTVSPRQRETSVVLTLVR